MEEVRSIAEDEDGGLWFGTTHASHMSVARQVVAWLEEGWPHLPDLTEEDCHYESRSGLGSV